MLNIFFLVRALVTVYTVTIPIPLPVPLANPPSLRGARGQGEPPLTSFYISQIMFSHMLVINPLYTNMFIHY